VPYNCVVLVKQVPDTQKISGKVMKDDGTVNRAALPAIFNPEDLNALELALQIKDEFGGKITAISMGLPSAAETLRQALYRGADEAILITDPKCAGSDTLATSYILACAVKKTDFDIVLCGRQAIDGDTAQVGPQIAEKIGITQITYVEELSDLKGREITIRRNIGNGFQVVKGQLPVLLTVLDTGNEPRVGVAKKMMKHKKARTPGEIQRQLKTDNPHADQNEIEELSQEHVTKLDESGSLIRQWTLEDLDADLDWCGLAGSPTKVHRIQSVVLTAEEVKDVEPTDEGISNLIHELIEDKAIA
jgi:electron transfer flavoprotein beta subunit